MSFKDIKGQDSAIRFLKGVLNNKRVSHAYIFLGPAGIGKKLTALNFAKALNCAGDEPPCDNCISCKKIDNSNHPDVFIFGPEKEGSSLKIEKIRELIKDISLKPYEGRKKVYIIDDASSMTQEASNALLKTLEEPPSDAVLILIVENISDILKTIASRSQIVKFHPLSIEDVRRILIDEHKVSDIKAHILSHFSSGRLGEAIRHKGDDFFERRDNLIDGLLNRTFFDSDGEVSKEDLRLYLAMMLTWYRDIMVAKLSTREHSLLVNVDRASIISNEARKLNFDYLEGVINEIIATSSSLEKNANPKLAMTVLGLKVQEG